MVAEKNTVAAPFKCFFQRPCRVKTKEFNPDIKIKILKYGGIGLIVMTGNLNEIGNFKININNFLTKRAFGVVQ
jgi:hypothetical protein